MHTTMCFLGMAFWFPILFYLGRVQWETAPNKLRDEENKTVLCLQNRNRSVLGWALLLPETGIAVPATLVSGLGEFVSSADTLPKHIVRSSLKFETEGFGDTLF